MFVFMDQDTLQINILDEIGGWGFTLKDLMDQTKGFKGSNVSIPVNSFGGSVAEGFSIHNAIKGMSQKTESYVVGYAMSMGTIVALAADVVKMPKNGYWMIHEPWMLAGGDASDMNKTSELLEKTAVQLAQIYSDKTGIPLAEIRTMMKEETWLTGQEAKNMGFVDELTEPVEITAKFDPTPFSNTPTEIINSFKKVNNKQDNKMEDLKKIADQLANKLSVEIDTNVEDAATLQANIKAAIEGYTPVDNQEDTIANLQAEVDLLKNKSGDSADDENLKIKAALIKINNKVKGFEDDLQATKDENQKLKNFIDQAALGDVLAEGATLGSYMKSTQAQFEDSFGNTEVKFAKEEK